MDPNITLRNNSHQYLLTEESPKALQPKEINITLKPHQLASLYKMCTLDQHCGINIEQLGIKLRSNIGILADLAGYGKTLTFLALVQTCKTLEINWMPKAQTFVNDGYGITITQECERHCIDTSLIVVPDNLTEHWKRHLDNYSDLSYEIVESTTCSKILVEHYDIIICPARHYNRFIKENCEHYWNRVAFDEADSIHIPNTDHVNARFLWLITATFDNIPNRKNRGFLKGLFRSQLYLEDPLKSYFGPVIIKGTDSFIKKSFSLIEPRIRYIDCLTPNFIKAVRGHISAYVLDLINAGDLNGAILALNGNIDNDRNIIDLVTRHIKNDIIQITSCTETLDQLELSNSEKNDKLEKLNDKLASLQERQRNLEKAISDAVGSECMICREVLSNPTIVQCCNNIFCAKCLLEWIKENSVCPMCRSPIDPSGFQTICSESEAKSIKNVSKIYDSKSKALIDILKSNLEGKFLIFSGHTATFKELSQQLDDQNISYGLLTNLQQIKVTLDKFCKGNLSIILLDTEHSSAGIEIPSTTDIILYHQLRASVEIQAIARAQRPGRKGQLNVWKLKYEHEYV